MQTDDSVYKQLHKEIDTRMPVGFPAHESGLEIELLKRLFTPEEAKIAIHLSALPEPAVKIHKRLKKNGITISLQKLEEILNSLDEKGAIRGGGSLYDHKRNRKRYSLAQWAVGIFEYQLGRLTREFAEIANEYSLDVFYKEFNKKDRPTQLHTIPVEKGLSPEYAVGTYDNIREIITNKVERIAILDCVCRQEHDILEEPCNLSDTRRCCVMFNESASRRIADGRGTEVSKEEFFKLLNKFQKEGFVLQPQNNQNPSYMCVCCGCCCGVLQMAKKFPNPAEYYSSNFYAQSNSELCNGCEVCINRCQMDAVKMIDDNAHVDVNRCIGCGNCVAMCGQKAMTLSMKEKVKVPEKSESAMYIKIMMKKRGFLGTLKMIGNMLAGRKV
jgi:Na+-translocating ferredoxin:NAD+ oxidoreductase RNF subunit RnfB